MPPQTAPEAELKERFPRDSAFSLTVYPTDTDEQRAELSSIVHDWSISLDTHVWPRALQWFQNTAFVLGQPYVQFQFDGQNLSTSSPRTGIHNAHIHIPKVVANYLIRPFEAVQSMFSETIPEPRVTPRSDDPQDEDAAKLAEIALKAVWEKPLNMQSKLRAVASELMLTGTVGIEVAFEESDAYQLPMPQMETVEVEDPLLGTITEEQEVGVEYKALKQLKVNVYNAFQLRPDPHANSDPDSLAWLGVQTYADMGWVKEAYDRDEPGFFPENLGRMTAEEGANSPLYWNERIKDLIDTPNETWAGLVGHALNTTSGVTPNEIIFRIFDVRPNRHYPKGRTLVFAGGQLIYASPKDVGSRAWSEKHPGRWTPITVLRYWTILGRFWGYPLMTALVPLQRRINAIDSLVQLSRQHLTLGGWLIPNTARIPNGFISGIPGQQIVYKVSHTGAKPERMQNEVLPSQLLDERGTMINDIDRISGVGAIMLGNTPERSNVRSAMMLDFAKRQSLQSKGQLFQGLQEALETVAQNILIELTELDDPDHPLSQKIVTAARNMGALAIDNFRGADLRDNVLVSFDIASALLKSPEAKEERAQAFLQYGSATGQLGPQEFRAIAKTMGLDEIVHGQNLHVEKVRRIVSLLKQGEMRALELVMPELEDPALAAEVVRDEILRVSEFTSLEPEIQSALMDLFEKYSDIAAERAAKQAEIQAITASMAPGGPAAPSEEPSA